MENMRYAADKPKECKYCYFWNCNKKCCSLTEERCYYILPPKEKLKPKSVCDGCAYAKNAPCIGFCMLNEFVEKILVHERDRKGSRQTTQEIEVYFNFIEKYLPPHFGEVHLTPEEEEELRKREERKDRLHQNYLRRKANGKQKAYEEKVKRKKKEKLDAQKEKIRQEDIARGVFIPAAMLPPAEPKKAARA